jgi:putative transposase
MFTALLYSAIMAATPKELEHQTMTSVGKVSVTDDSTAILLGLIGFSATKLWNTAVWYTRKTWEATGKIPACSALDVAMKQERSLWYRRLHSQSAQAALEDLWQSYKSWYALRKNDDKKAKPPGYRSIEGNPPCRPSHLNNLPLSGTPVLPRCG